MDTTKHDLPENLREQAGVYTLPHGRAPPFPSFPRILSIRHFCAQADDEDQCLSAVCGSLSRYSPYNALNQRRHQCIYPIPPLSALLASWQRSVQPGEAGGGSPS
jgi:hypothetical protein